MLDFYSKIEFVIKIFDNFTSYIEKPRHTFSIYELQLPDISIEFFSFGSVNPDPDPEV